MKLTHLGLEFEVKHIPALDRGFIPLAPFLAAHKKNAAPDSVEIALGVERGGGQTEIISLNVSKNLTEADKYAAERIVKSMLWVYGGHNVIVYGHDELSDWLSGVYTANGERGFDADFMSLVYEKPFTVTKAAVSDIPEKQDVPSAEKAVSAEGLKGCRIGFDAGGSDLKVSAVIDGEAVFSEEIVWLPKINDNPEYHYKFISDAMKLAASKMPRVDAIGVSSAGIYVNNRTMVASLFLKVPRPEFDKHVKDIYIRAAKEIGCVPLVVANDGDVTALAGAMEYGDNEVLGIAMGTSQAGGYVDKNGGITGWLNELAFMPVDANPTAMRDEWSGDIGCGVKYFSQDGVIKLGEYGGIKFEESATPAEKLKHVQELMKNGDETAIKIYQSLGVYLGYSIGYYSMFYSLKHLLLMGRVMSGDGGAVIFEKAKEVLADEFPDISKALKLHLPDEKSRRVGQSIAAASLPRL